MPELPEVETVRRGLLKHLPGREITRVKVWREDSIGSPDAGRFARSLTGKRFKNIDRRGKYLLFQLEPASGLVVHLRMSGRLLLIPPKGKKPEHLRIEMSLDNGQSLLFDDMRVFGRIWYVPPSERFEEVVTSLAMLGPEPLESLKAEYLQESLRKKTQSIKAALLDQTIVAGIGNIYADESLHHAHINPNRPAQTLSLMELEDLVEAVRQVLSNAITLGGSTLRNYTDSSGTNGNYQHAAFVYGRYGQPCRNCQTPIMRVRLAGRSSHFCPKCQSMRRRSVR